MPERTEWLPSLKDLDGVRVAVEGPLPAVVARGPVPLKLAIENQLRSEGITVLGMGEFPTGDPHLRLTLSEATRSDMVACYVQLDFVQIVFMRRNPAVTFNRARTWAADGHVVIAPAQAIGAAIRDEVTTQVAQFAADYRLANA